MNIYIRNWEVLKRPTRVWISIFASVYCLCLPLAYSQQKPGQKIALKWGAFDQIVPYVPTPPDIVEKMLRLAGVNRDDVVYDLGSGDGRIVIMAAQKFDARAVGIELDKSLVDESSAQVKALGLEKQVKIIQGNFFHTDLSPATVVTLFLLTAVNEQLRPILQKQLRPGTRVVSHEFEVPGWKPEKVVTLKSKNGVPHTIYLYRRP